LFQETGNHSYQLAMFPDSKSGNIAYQFHDWLLAAGQQPRESMEPEGSGFREQHQLTVIWNRQFGDEKFGIIAITLPAATKMTRLT